MKRHARRSKLLTSKEQLLGYFSTENADKFVTRRELQQAILIALTNYRRLHTPWGRLAAFLRKDWERTKREIRELGQVLKIVKKEDPPSPIPPSAA